MPRTETVTLAGREYEIAALPIRQARAWRQRLGQSFGDMAAMLVTGGNVELTNLSQLGTLIQDVNRNILGSIDLVLELLYAWAPALHADRERIETEAYDDEVVRAFTAVLRLAYPFGELRALLVSRNGATMTPTT